MKIGLSLRNMGPQSTTETLSSCAIAADQAGIESLWVTDHIAIPPDDAEGSGGRYLDPLATLAWLAGQTQQIKLGTSVLILPYREPLATAKWISTVQELSGERLILGVGIGWMKAEFQAVGRNLRHRVKDSEAVLSFLHTCFKADVATANGQEFLFKPRPVRPPILVGGKAPHAIKRALTFGDGWMPMGPLERLRDDIGDYRARAESSGQTPEVVLFGRLPAADNEVEQYLKAHEDAGVTRLILGRPYDTAAELVPFIEQIAAFCQRSE